MKINQIISEMTSGSVASVAKPMGEVQKRPDVKGLKPVNKLLSEKPKKKGPYANSLSESNTKEEIRKTLKEKPVQEAKLDEDDLIIMPGQSMRSKTGLVPHGKSRVDHEVDMARSDLISCVKNARSIYELIKNRSEDEGLEGWVQEKLIKASDYLNAVKEYLDGKIALEMNAGVIAAGGVGEDVNSAVKEKIESQAQWRLMHGVAHDPKFAKKVGIAPKVGKEFVSKTEKSYTELPKKKD